MYYFTRLPSDKKYFGIKYWFGPERISFKSAEKTTTTKKKKKKKKKKNT